MQLNVTGHHVEITPPLREFIASKLNRIQRHIDNVVDAHCILTVEKLRHKAEATINLGGGRIFAESVEADMYAAIDGLVDKLDRQVKKYKEKNNNHHPRQAQKLSRV